MNPFNKTEGVSMVHASRLKRERGWRKKAVCVTPLGRFMSSFEENGILCWPWLGTKDKLGYGLFCSKPWSGYGFTKHKKIYAHRLTYQLWRGSVPAGLELDHLCRNSACVNPFHLEAVTHQVNIARGKAFLKAQRLANV